MQKSRSYVWCHNKEATARWYLVIWMFRHGQLSFHFSLLESENIDLQMIPQGLKVQNIYIFTHALNVEVVMGSVFLHLLIVETTGCRSFLRVLVAPKTSCDIKGKG